MSLYLEKRLMNLRYRISETKDFVDAISERGEGYEGNEGDEREETINDDIIKKIDDAILTVGTKYEREYIKRLYRYMVQYLAVWSANNLDRNKKPFNFREVESFYQYVLDRDNVIENSSNESKFYQ